MRHGLLDKMLIGLFFLILFLPGLGLFKKPNSDQIRALLNREVYDFPKVDIKNLGRTDFKAIENWFADRALFFNDLSKFWSNVMYEMGSSIKPGQAILGKNHWLFLGNDYAATLDQYTGKNQPSEKEIYLKASALKHMQQIAHQNGAKFLVVIAPDKQDVYPEYLPKYLKKGAQPNRLDYLEQLMSRRHIDFIDLRHKELKAKETLGKKYGDLYLKGDSHWNYLGAYVAYQSMAHYFKKHHLIAAIKHHQFTPRQTRSSDLTNFLQLTDVFSNNPLPDVSGLNIERSGQEWGQNTPHTLEVFEGNPNLITTPFLNINKQAASDQTCLLIGDSFSEALSFYLQHDFRKVIRIHSGNTSWNLSALMHYYHPDVVVYEKVERDLLYPIGTFQITADKMKLPSKKSNARLYGAIERFKIKPDVIEVAGWAYVPHLNAGIGQVYLQLMHKHHRYLFSMNQVQKQSVHLALKHDGENLDLSGFSGVIARRALPHGTYEVTLVVVNQHAYAEKKCEAIQVL